MAESQLQQIWQQALYEYKKEACNDLNDESLPHPENVEQLISILQTKHDDFDKETGRGKQFSGYLRGAVGPFNFLQNMFGGMAGAAFPPSSQVLGAVAVLVQAGKDVAGAFDAVSTLFKKLASFMGRFQALSSEQIDEELTPILAKVLAAMLKVLALATKRTHAKGTELKIKHPHWERAKRTIQTKGGEYLRQLFLGSDEEIESAVEGLKFLIEQEQMMTVTLTKRDTTKLKTDTMVIKSDTSVLINDTTVLKEALKDGNAHTHRMLETLIEAQARERADRSSNIKPPPKMTVSQKSSVDRFKALRDRLNPLATDATEIDRMRRERVDGTLEGVSKDASVLQWLDRKVSVLQLAAGVGTGKSFFAARVVDLLHEYKQGSADATRHYTAFHFWKQRSDRITSIPNVLQTLAFQIAQADEAYREHLSRELSKQKADGTFEETVQFWWKLLFESYFRKARAWAYIVFDGLDDADEAEKDMLLSCFKDLLVASDGRWPLHLQLFFSTGPALQEEISIVFLDQATKVQWANTSDLDVFIGKRLEKVWKNMLVDLDLYQNARAAILEAAQGSFLLASLLVDDVTALSREKDVRERLLTLPVNLDSATPLALSRLERQLDHEDIVDLTDILAWVICTHRNLTLKQLDAILSLRSSQRSSIIDLETRISGRFASLFVLSHSDLDSDLDREAASTRKKLADHEFVDQSGERLPATDQDQNDTSQTGQAFGNLAQVNAVTQRLANTYVRFEHGLIADHIRNDFAINLITGTRMDEMRINVLRECLEILCGEPGIESEKRTTALAYCGLFVSDHLMDVDLSKVDGEAKQWMASQLVKLFRDDATIDRWITASGRWLRTDVLLNQEVLDRVRLWFEDEESRFAFDEDTLQWLEAVALNPAKVLFERLATTSARRWLLQRDNLGVIHFEFVNTYLTMIQSPGERLPEPDEDLSVRGATVDRVRVVARWANLDETAFWHTRIGFALRNGGHWTDAVNEYELAREKEHADAAPVSALAIIHDSNGRYADAVRLSALAIELIKGHLEKGAAGSSPSTEWMTEENLYEQYVSLGDYCTYQQDMTAAVESYTAGFERWLDPSEDTKSALWQSGSRAVTSCFAALCADEKFDEAMHLMQTINEHPKRHSKEFAEVYVRMSMQYLVRLGYETKRLDVLDRFFLNAIWTLAHYGTGPQTASMRYDRALAILRLDRGRQAYALEIFESIDASDNVDPPEFVLYGTRVQNEKTLAKLLLDFVLQAREEDRWSVVGQYAEKLKETIQPGAAEGTEMVLATWERLNGRPHRAKQYLMGQIGTGVDMLLDDDPLNDTVAWMYLGDVFLALGDNAKAITCTLAMLHLGIISILEDKEEQAGQTSDTSELEELGAAARVCQDPKDEQAETGAPEGPGSPPNATADVSKSKLSISDLKSSVSIFSCDGPCFGVLSAQEPMYRCSFCITDYCQKCHDLIMSGDDIGWNICGKLHEHVVIPAIKELFPDGKLKVGNDFVDFESWKNAMQAEYGLMPRQIAVPSLESKDAAEEVAPDNVSDADLVAHAEEGASQTEEAET